MILLTADEIIYIHAKLIKSTGGLPDLRDRDLLESAVYSTETAFNNDEKYPTVQEKAARLAFSLISNHAFFDGNKRIGILVMLMTKQYNNNIYTTGFN
jgi:death-on-curing family protein